MKKPEAMKPRAETCGTGRPPWLCRSGAPRERTQANAALSLLRQHGILRSFIHVPLVLALALVAMPAARAAPRSLDVLRLVQMLGQQMPQGVLLREVNCQLGSAELQGLSLTAVRIARLMHGLDASDLLGNIRLISVRSEQYQTQRVNAFSLRMQPTAQAYSTDTRPWAYRAEVETLLTGLNQAAVGRGLYPTQLQPLALEGQSPGQLPLKLNLEGPWSGLAAFFGDVSRLPYAILVQSFHLQGTDTGSVNIGVELRIPLRASAAGAGSIGASSADIPLLSDDDNPFAPERLQQALSAEASPTGQ